mmetsp:Transcript_92507/g.260868  ORF Transcript_92507/g.260868 Transcript_92507/m.260868 type:complete len:219 (-) Transcript_92507:26-682(-)
MAKASGKGKTAEGWAGAFYAEAAPQSTAAAEAAVAAKAKAAAKAKVVAKLAPPAKAKANSVEYGVAIDGWSPSLASPGSHEQQAGERGFDMSGRELLECGVRLHKCEQCRHVREGWDDIGEKGWKTFYCTMCWFEYDASIHDDVEFSADDAWQNQIISAERDLSTHSDVDRKALFAWEEMKARRTALLDATGSTGVEECDEDEDDEDTTCASCKLVPR